MSRVFAIFLLFPASLAQYQAVLMYTDKTSCSSTPYEILYSQSSGCNTMACSYGTVEKCVASVPPPTATQFAIIDYIAGSTNCSGTISQQNVYELGACFGPTPGFYMQFVYTAGSGSITVYDQCDTQCSACQLKNSMPLGCTGRQTIVVGSAV
eukprot:TRINITY_DN15040_c0_g1_i1.p2 TRINITY_DN15040_c0_g1~~TRINITY_DN15040_c0_g1_i1.p2  ORF type:complete len:153 (+),score=42.22 TRINITY_DN15040_c0_g1_i1:116-574(+)